MIDIGANLSHEQFKDDLPHVLDKAFKSNLDGIILTSTDLNSFERNIDIIKKYNQYNLYTTIGLHPHNAKDFANFRNKFLDALQSENLKHIVSIGEFGLDYYRMKSSKEEQLNVVQEILNVAKNTILPLFLHERGAFSDFSQILKSYQGENKKVVHCFTGNKEQLKTYLDLDCYIGITGWITDKNRNKDLLEAIKYIPIDKIMIETDCPYLCPKNMPLTHRRNEPAYLYYICTYLATIYAKNCSQIVHNLNHNTTNFFGINLTNINLDISKNKCHRP